MAPPPTPDLGVFLLMYPVMLIANLAIMLPFLFTFQLIADRNLPAIPAMKMSFQGVVRNFWGVLGYLVVLTIVSVVLTMMCYVPGILFLPISLGTLFLLYRDIFPPPISQV